MNEREGDKGSFDPKTWLSPGTAPVRAPATENQVVAPTSAQELSFDFSKLTQIPNAPRAASDDEGAPPPTPPGRDEMKRRSPPPLAGGVCLALLLAGGAIAYFARGTGSGNVTTPVVGTTSVATPDDKAAAQPPSRRTLVLSGPEGIPEALKSAGIVPAEAAAAAAKAMAILGPAAGEVRLSFDIQGPPGTVHLLQFEATRSDGSGISLARADDSAFSATRLDAKLETRINVVRGEMDGDSFYTSAVAAGVTDSLISDFANAFSFDFNFQTEVGPGDVFEAAFEQAYNPSGQAVGVPKLVYVSLSTAAKSRSLYRFVPPGESEPGWFDGNGRSTVKSLMRTPIDGARITSKFGMRFHPVLHYTRLHGGTDFAAPIGTPIYAAAAGVVTSASPSSCAGNMVIIHHDNGWETRYFHLVRYAPGVVAGLRVTQGYTIGFVGTTGICTTGPHLHYEVHINGEKVDPLSIDTGTGKALAGAQLVAFNRERDRIDTRRAAGVH